MVNVPERVQEELGGKVLRRERGGVQTHDFIEQWSGRESLIGS